MKIELSEKTIKLLHWMGIVTYYSEKPDKHKKHHVYLVSVRERVCEFYCADCEEKWLATLEETNIAEKLNLTQITQK